MIGRKTMTQSQKERRKKLNWLERTRDGDKENDGEIEEVEVRRLYNIH